MKPKENLDKRILNEIIKAVQQINYGEVAITIHNSKVVQIERKEKKRFDLKSAIQMEAKN